VSFAPAAEWASFIAGGDAEGRATPGGVAWALETLAVAQGWPSGVSLGTESDLMTRFAASRAVVRQTVRILESRGSMRMRRGCRGGLYLIESNLDTAASALATYVRASGVSASELAETTVVADALFAELGADQVLFQLYARSRDFLLREESAQREGSGRALAIANDFIRHSAPIPEAGAYLGSEAELCERFNSCRSTFRQALRILHDLGMLRVKRGRAGGYWLERPSPIGVIRQVYACLGSQQQRLEQIVPATWVLNLVQLRLVMRQLRREHPRARAQLCDSLAALLAHPEEPYRWALLQHALANRGGSTLSATLQRSIVAYQARLGVPAVAYSGIARELQAAEQAIVDALRGGADDDAERAQRGAHDRLSELLLAH
jgi:DNA-binding FadR family transcriptional regulator